jgi:hypothetical protein
MGRRAKPSTDNPNEPATRLPPQRYALGLLTPKKDGCTITMLLARGVKVETIDELLAAGLAIKKSELVGRGRPIEITRIAITDAGRRALERDAALWIYLLCPVRADIRDFVRDNQMLLGVYSHLYIVANHTRAAPACRHQA